jgi:hypothetical protein
MKHPDDFLRYYHRPPRNEFSKDLFRQLTGRKSAVGWLRRITVLSLAAAALVYGMSADLLNSPGNGAFATLDTRPVALNSLNPAQAAEHGLTPGDLFFAPGSDDRLGPFDQAMAKAAFTRNLVEEFVMVLPAERK